MVCSVRRSALTAVLNRYSTTIRSSNGKIIERARGLSTANQVEQNKALGTEGTGPVLNPNMYNSPIVDAYNKDGFVIIRDAIDKDLVAEMQSHVDWLATRDFLDGVPPEHWHHPIMRNDPFWVRLISDKRLVDLAELFIGPNIALFSSHYFCKMPQTGRKVLWHQDGAYWPIRPMNVVTLWLAADTSDYANGCLRCIRGSHMLELSDLRESKNFAAPSSTEHNDVLGFGTHSDEEASALGEIVDLELQPGDVSVHHPNCVHSSEPNMSDRRRCGLTIRYIPTDVRCFMEEQPVMIFRGDPVPDVNWYRSWPKYRPGYDMPFAGCDSWNERRYKDDKDEKEYFGRSDYATMESEIREELNGFITQLGGF